MARLLVLALGVSALGCSDDDGVSLFVDVRTDFIAGFEFVAALTSVDGRPPVRQGALVGEVWTDPPVRAAEVEGLSPGSRGVRVWLVDDTEMQIAERIVRLDHTADTGVTVTITRTCRSLGCPGLTDDPALESCQDGVCVDPRCVEEDISECPAPTCESDADCPARGDCATGRCRRAGVCVYESDDTRCAASEYCAGGDGCTPRPDTPQDAGRSDAGAPDPDAGAPDPDAGRPDAGRPDAGPRRCSRDSDCGTVVWRRTESWRCNSRDEFSEADHDVVGAYCAGSVCTSGTRTGHLECRCRNEICSGTCSEVSNRRSRCSVGGASQPTGTGSYCDMVAATYCP